MGRLRSTLVVMIAVTSVCPAAQDRTSVVTGFVRYASGGAIEDVRVSMIVPGDPVARTTRTDADGSYRFEALPEGEYQISASIAGAVAKPIAIAPGSEWRNIDFSIPDGGSLRLVTGQVVMNDSSRSRQIPARVGVGIIMRADGTVVVPRPPGDHRLFVRLPPGYFLDSATLGSTLVYSLQSVGGRRLSSAAFAITVPPEPEPIPELVITVGAFPSN